MIKFKRNVKGFSVLSQEMKDGLIKLDDELFAQQGLDLWVTSTDDGKHMFKSKHYDKPCNASDIRIWNILEMWVREMKAALGDDYDVVFEGDHFHIEWDPK